jgi:hypothetical protein
MAQLTELLHEFLNYIRVIDNEVFEVLKHSGSDTKR